MKLEYKSFLEGELKIAIIMCSILTIVALVALIFPFTYKSDRAYKIFAPILFVIVIIISLLWILPYVKDINNDTLIEYIGEIVVEDVFQGKGTPVRATVVISDQKITLNLHDKNTDIHLGNQNVRILYSKHTKYLFEYEILDE